MGEEETENNGGSKNDLLLKLKAKVELPPDPRQYSDLPVPNPSETSPETNQIPEKDLPIVREAEEATLESRNQGKLISASENPMGQVDSALIYIMGDLHLPATNPHQAAESRSPILRGLMVETGPRSVIGHIKGKDWYHEERPEVSMDAYLQMEEAVAADIGKRAQYGEKGKAVLIMDLGDRSYNDIGISDTAGIALSFEGMRERAEDVLQKSSGNENARVYQAMVKGNHDADIINFGLQQEAEERKLYGSQIFFQEVGANHGLLVLNTNFSSEYWNRYYNAQKKGDKSEEDKKLIEQIDGEINYQQKIIRKAAESGRKLIVAGHQADQIERLMDLPSTNVERVLVGHVDPPEKDQELKIKNKNGQNIHLTRVGGALGIPGWELKRDRNMNPTGYVVEIKKDINGQESVTVEELPIPEAAKELKYLI